MISVSSILAWVYCLIEYRDTPALIVGVSVLVVGSFFALLNVIISLRITKDNQLKNYIAETIAKSLASINSESDDEGTRVAKASYVQQRKTNQILSQMLEFNRTDAAASKEIVSDNIRNIIDSINKSTKVIIKYSANNNDKISSENNILAEKTDNIQSLLSDIAAELKSLSYTLSSSSTIIANNTTNNNTDDIDNIESIDSIDNIDSIDSIDSIDNIDSIDKNEDIGNDVNAESPDLDSFFNEFASEEPASKNESASVIPFPASSEEAIEPDAQEPETTFDPNRTLTPEEIATLFAAQSPQEQEENVTPKEKVPKEEATKEEAANDDPNRQLTPEEIAALFASVQ